MSDLNQTLTKHARTVFTTLRDRKAVVQFDDPWGRVFADAGLMALYLKPAQSTKVANILNLESDVALAVGQPKTRIVEGVGNLVVEIPHGDRARVEIETMLTTKRGPYSAIIGRDLHRNPQFIDFTNDNTPHVLIAGTTGSGKTAVAQSAVLSLVHQHPRSELRLIVIDPKPDRWWFTPKIQRHLAIDIARAPEQARHVLGLVCTHMEKVNAPVSRLVIYVDEMADIVQTGGDDVMQMLTRIAQRGRESGLHLIGCTQKPSAKELGPLLVANFPLRLVGRVVNSSDSNLACGQAGCGAEKLLGHGDFLRVEGGNVTRIQAAIPRDYGKPNPNGAPARFDDWTVKPTAPQPEKVAPAAPAVRIEAPPVAEAGLGAEPMMPTDDLMDYQARIVIWYRRANPKDGYTHTELARAVWPHMKTLAGNYLHRIKKIVERAADLTT